MGLKPLPQKVDLEINGNLYKFSTDYRFFIGLSNLSTNKATETECKEYLLECGLPLCSESFEAISNLYFPKQEGESTKIRKKLNFQMKYDVLWNLIFSAFYEKYNIDLDEIEFLHYKKFDYLLNSLTQTRFNDVLIAWGTDLSKLKSNDKEQRERIIEIREDYPLGIAEKSYEEKMAEFDEETLRIQEELAKKRGG